MPNNKKVFTPKTLPSDTDVLMPGWTYDKKLKKAVKDQKKKSKKKK